MGMRVPALFHAHCAVLTAPRCPYAPPSRHLLMAIRSIAGWAVSSGAEGWEDSAEDGAANVAWRGDLLDVPQGLPGHDPCRRVVSQVAPEALTQGCIAWTPARREASGGARVSSDGTPLRQACAQATATAALPMVRAWASAHRVVGGHLHGEAQSNASPALPQLLPLVDRTGAVGTLAALGGQKESAQPITAQGADDVLALKDTHPTRSEAVTRLLHAARAPGGYGQGTRRPRNRRGGAGAPGNASVLDHVGEGGAWRAGRVVQRAPRGDGRGPSCSGGHGAGRDAGLAHVPVSARRAVRPGGTATLGHRERAPLGPRWLR
jgi:DDE_Tnp_1-associated